MALLTDNEGFIRTHKKRRVDGQLSEGSNRLLVFMFGIVTTLVIKIQTQTGNKQSYRHYHRSFIVIDTSHMA